MEAVIATTGFAGASVAVFERRMADALAKSVQSHGGVAVSAPAMREVPLSSNREALAFGEQLLAGRIDVVICMTGVGTRMLLELLGQTHEPEHFLEALRHTTIVARGPKPLRVLGEFKIPVTISVPEPNTWQEIVQALDLSHRSVELAGKTVAIQEYGMSSPSLVQALRQRGATMVSVPVYRWALPEDLGPLTHAIDRLIAGTIQFALFTNTAQVRHLLQVAESRGVEPALRAALARVVLASIGPTTTDTMLECGLPVDFEPSRPKMGPLIDELATQASALLAAKMDGAGRRWAQRSQQSYPPAAAERRRHRPFLAACHREPTKVTPVWLMRQAGRYLSEYRAIRNKVPFLQLCKDKELAAEITVMAVEKLGVDAAIIFSDILLVAEPFGLGLEYTPGDGPVISGAVTTGADIDRLPELEPAESLAFVFDAIRLARAVLHPTIPLIGFSGAPFTLAAYLVEGGSSKSFLATKALMYQDPGAWHALLEKISRGLIKYLNGQIAAGADAVQLFDTWVGCLAPEDYRTFVLPHTRDVIQALTPTVPVIHFGTGCASLLTDQRAAGGSVLSVDFRVELDQAWQTIGAEVAIQGNLDPAVLLAPPAVIRRHVQRILRQAGGRPGHIFNLGHGVLPATPVDHVVALVEMVHELSQHPQSS